mmetsp:Transcript_6455/g.13783  ORF Transcript_6455/g.13783 Transcript_6455/m.13783 type:complete len:572 (+) Transcript_6455:81-1796(+)
MLLSQHSRHGSRRNLSLFAINVITAVNRRNASSRRIRSARASAEVHNTTTGVRGFAPNDTPPQAKTARKVRIAPSNGSRRNAGGASSQNSRKKRKELKVATEGMVKLREVLDEHKNAGANVVVLKAGRGKFFRMGSPLVFDDSIASESGVLNTGDFVTVIDPNGSQIGWGMYNARSMYRVRMIWCTALDGELPAEEASKPDTLLRKVVESRVKRAASVRSSLGLPSPETDVFRAVNGEGDRLSGLAVDVFARVAVVSSSALWIELWFNAVAPAINSALLGTLADRVVWRISADRLIQDGLAKEVVPFLSRARLDPGVPQITREELLDCESTQSPGVSGSETENDTRINPHEMIQIRENRLLFEVNVTSGQKTGWYADQRENRARFGQLCEGKRVLDCYCFSGGFGLSAARNGASEVTCVDSSQAAVDASLRSLELNRDSIPAPDTVHIVKSDVLQFLQSAVNRGDQWDAVALDPPKLAPNRQALQRALAMYRRVNRLGLQAVRPGGILLTCSCSSAVTSTSGLLLKTVHEAAAEVNREIAVLSQSGASPCHVLNPAHLESSYLTCLTICVL